MKIGTREVTPQWMDKSNLGTYELPTVELETTDVQGLLALPNVAPTIVRLLNGAIHINASSKTIVERISEELPERRKDEKGKWAEKLLAWKERVFGIAFEVMKELPGTGYSLDFKAMLLCLAENERKEKVSDPIILALRTKWEGSDKKLAFLAKLGLPSELETATAGEVEKAYLELGEDLL
jgi:hypothetical protein